MYALPHEAVYFGVIGYLKHCVFNKASTGTSVRPIQMPSCYATSLQSLEGVGVLCIASDPRSKLIAARLSAETSGVHYE